MAMGDAPTPPLEYLSLLNALWEKGLFDSPAAERTFAYGFDLTNLRKDFDRMEDSLSWWWLFAEKMGSNEIAHGLMMNKFLLTYLEYNTTIWVHLYRERVFQFTNAALSLGVPEDEFHMITRVNQILSERGHLDLLRHLGFLTEKSQPLFGMLLSGEGTSFIEYPNRHGPAFGLVPNCRTP